MNVLKIQLFFVQCRFAPYTLKLPGRHITKKVVIALGFAIRRLMFGAEMPAAGFLAAERVTAQKLGELQEIRDPPGAFQGLIERCPRPEHFDIPPKFFAQFRNTGDGFL